jgi:hypothetical protein
MQIDVAPEYDILVLGKCRETAFEIEYHRGIHSGYPRP